MENIERLGYYYNTNDHHQRQTYISNYLEGGSSRNDFYGKGKAAMTEAYSTVEDQNMPIKSAPFSNTSRHQFSRTVPEWNTVTLPRYEFPYCESPRSYTMEQTPQSCMYSGARGFYEHYVNHARSQVEWMRDLSQGRTNRQMHPFI